MNKEELVEILAAEHSISKAKAKAIIRTFLGAVQSAVVRGDKVSLVGFGLFEAIITQPRIGRNPQTGAVVEIGEKRRPRFVPGRTFKAAVSGEAVADETEEE
jgi:DNA-binding protein HU-beta